MLAIEHLTKHYPGTDKGVTDLSLTVKAGDICAFIGSNGAGKTTTLKAVCGIHPFEKGEIYIDGKSIRQEPDACKRALAYIPDNPDLYEYLTGTQYLNFIGDVFGISEQDRKNRTEHYGKRLEILDALGELIGSYSHGMKQKLAILAGFLHNPKLLVLDEPFVGLDPQAAFTVKKMMKAHCASGGAVFYSTHVLEVAEKLCSQVAILRNGRLLLQGSMEEILSRGQSLESIFMEVAADVSHDPDAEPTGR